MAEGAKKSCLTVMVGDAMSGLDSLPVALVLLILCLVTSAVSQIASNAGKTILNKYRPINSHMSGHWEAILPINCRYRYAGGVVVVRRM